MEIPKLLFCALAIRVPWLREFRVNGKELKNEQDYPYAIDDHAKVIPVGHSLLDMKELSRPVHVTHQQSVPVEIEAEGELRTTRPLESDVPHHFHPIILIE